MYGGGTLRETHLILGDAQYFKVVKGRERKIQIKTQIMTPGSRSYWEDPEDSSVCSPGTQPRLGGHDVRERALGEAVWL